MSGSDCDLCGLPLIGRPVTQETHEFCCEGCRRVWVAAESSGIEGLLSTPESRRARATRAAERKADAARAAGARRDTLRVSGMWCASCATVLEDAFLGVPGVLDVEVSYAASLARVTYDPELIDPTRLGEHASRLGYSTEPARIAQGAQDGVEDAFLRFFVSAAISMWIMWPALFVLYPAFARGAYGEIVAWNFFVGVESMVVLLYGGWPFLVGAWRAARVGRATMDTLVVLGTWTGFLYSVWATLTASGPTYFDSAAMITTIVLAGRWLESLGRRDAARSIARLAETAVAEEAWLLGDDSSLDSAVRVDVTAIREGDNVAVRAGERVPVDGVVVRGESELDVSHLTGEPLPRATGTGDTVWAGAINLDATLVVRTDRVGADTLTGRLAAIAEDAVFAKSSAQRLADTVASIFVPLVLVLAAMTVIVTSVNAGLSEGVTRAVAVLVVACPCALGLATPLVVVNAMTAGSRHGMLIRGGPTLESAGSIAVVAFDKTGTVTVGHPVVLDVLPARGWSTHSVLLIAASLEVGEAHPVAQAIVTSARSTGEAVPRAVDVGRRAGRGVRGLVDGREVLVGSEALLDEVGAPVGEDARSAVEGHRSAGRLAVWVAVDREVVGAIVLMDAIRAEAPAAVAALQAMGVEVALISGDASATTSRVADAVGADRSFGDVLPHDKERILHDLANDADPERRRATAFVGDGVNDAAALAAADIAVSVAGAADVAMLAADVVALDEDRPLTSMPALIMIARSSGSVIRQNLAWAFSYNLITLPMAVLGVLDPIWAAVAMALSSLAVIANSWRVRFAGGKRADS